MSNCKREGSQERLLYLYRHFLFRERTLNKSERKLQASLRILCRDVFNSVSKFFVLPSAILAFSIAAAAPSLGKQNSHHYSYPPEPAYEAVYAPAQFWYEDGKAERQYSQTDSYFQNFFYHLWYWLWANIVPVIIIVLITWIFFRIYYSALIK